MPGWAIIGDLSKLLAWDSYKPVASPLPSGGGPISTFSSATQARLKGDRRVRYSVYRYGQPAAGGKDRPGKPAKELAALVEPSDVNRTKCTAASSSRGFPLSADWTSHRGHATVPGTLQPTLSIGRSDVLHLTCRVITSHLHQAHEGLRACAQDSHTPPHNPVMRNLHGDRTVHGTVHRDIYTAPPSRSDFAFLSEHKPARIPGSPQIPEAFIGSDSGFEKLEPCSGSSAWMISAFGKEHHLLALLRTIGQRAHFEKHVSQYTSQSTKFHVSYFTVNFPLVGHAFSRPTSIFVTSWPNTMIITL